MDDLTVRFDLENSDPNFAQKCHVRDIPSAEHVYGGMTREEFDRHPSWTTSDGVGPIGLGPFKMAKLVPNSSRSLLRSTSSSRGAEYRQSRHSEYRVPGTPLSSLCSGGTSTSPCGPIVDRDPRELRQDPRFNVVGSLPTNDFTYYINNHVEDLRNEKFRLAFAKAFDRQALLDGFAGGLGVTLPITSRCTRTCLSRSGTTSTITIRKSQTAVGGDRLG